MSFDKACCCAKPPIYKKCPTNIPQRRKNTSSCDDLVNVHQITSSLKPQAAMPHTQTSSPNTWAPFCKFSQFLLISQDLARCSLMVIAVTTSFLDQIQQLCLHYRARAPSNTGGPSMVFHQHKWWWLVMLPWGNKQCWHLVLGPFFLNTPETCT